MSDGLEWLICDEPCKAMDARSGCHCAKARDEIARLKAEVERLRAALERDAVYFDSLKKPAYALIARAALTPSQEPRA
jgi:hypothetical protein